MPVTQISSRDTHVARHATASDRRVASDRPVSATGGSESRVVVGVASRAMGPTILAESWIYRYDNVVIAIVAILLTFIALRLVNRWITRELMSTAVRVRGRDLSPGAETRLRVTRRLIDAAIVVIGLTVAISQFAALGSLASALFASSALVAAVIGFAARQPVANAVAGVVLASSQPIRVGDLVTFQGESGVVEDVRLTSTVVRTSTGAHLIVPNETFVSGIVRNDSLPGTPVTPEAAVWLPHGIDVAAAVAATTGAEEGIAVSVAETTPEGLRLSVTAPPVPADERASREAALRLTTLDAIHRAGLHP